MGIIKNRETILSDVNVVSVCETEKISRVAKNNMEKVTNNNDKVVLDSKPKIIIKIPKPFAKGYIIIDLSKFLNKLIIGLSSVIVAILLSKIANIITNKLQDKLLNNETISNDLINNELNKLDINKLISESINDYDKSSKDTILKIDDKSKPRIIDIYNKPKSNLNNNKEKYTIDKRNRTDVLDSSIVSERYIKNKKEKIIKNKNYGAYYD